MSDKLNKKQYFASRIIILAIFMVANFFIAFTVWASAGAVSIVAGEGEDLYSFTLTQNGKSAKIFCPDVGGGGVAMSTDIQAMITCVMNQTSALGEMSVEEIVTNLEAQKKKRQREEWFSQLKDSLRQTLAVAFKSSLKLFTRQIAHDTAVWVASGGRGQQPLFITEGWGAYLKNIADVALGDFIQGIGSTFGVDLCQPNFQVKLAIQVGLNYGQGYQARRTGCPLSTLVNNWQSAISKASFSVDYKTSMRPGQNDISFALMMADQRNAYVAAQVQAGTKSAEINQLFKDIKNIAGKILTPGTFIADELRKNNAKADTGMATFTNTIADMIEEFLNTLVAQLLQNLMSGFFSSSGGGATGVTSPSQLATLFNPNASPLGGSISAAKERFMNLLVEKSKVGGKYDILIKLAQCAESDKNNPGPTDCVIDQKLVTAIRSEIFVTDLPAEVKNRAFASPPYVITSLENSIPYRSIIILRKYRIVPVGWEMAAQLIQGRTDLKSYTLGQIMDCFYGVGINNCSTNEFKGMIDPYWVLKAPELFCRDQGYGGKNSDTSGTGISRVEYCADEEQCLSEDENGNCTSYGYCTRERRMWNFGKSCDSRYNTCQTYKSASGATASYLSNTLDFLNCNAQNAGCRSFATNFNMASKEWNGDIILDNTVDKVSNHASADLTSGLDVAVTANPGWNVPEGKNISVNYQLQMSSPCSSSTCQSLKDTTGCAWDADAKSCKFNDPAKATCSIPAGGISCYVEACFASDNLLGSLNSDFENFVSPNPGNSTNWTDELSYLDNNNRHFRDATHGRAGAGLHLVAANNSRELVTTLDNISTTPDTTYLLSYYIRGTISDGSVAVQVYASGSPLYGDRTNATWFAGQPVIGSVAGWTKVELSFTTAKNTGIMIGIITAQNSITDVYLDDFELKQMKRDCAANSVKLYTPLQTIADGTGATAIGSPTNLYFDRDAQTCTAASDGCSQFIRTKPGLGTNLVPNSGFELGNLQGWTAVSYSDSAGTWEAVNNNAAIVGSYSVKSITTTLGSGGAQYVLLTPANIQLAKGKKYILSAWVNVTSVSDPTSNGFGFDLWRDSPAGAVAEKMVYPPFSGVTTNSWFRLELPINPNQDFSDLRIRLRNGMLNVPVYFDNIQLEEVNNNIVSASDYKDYGTANLLYLNKAPDYLNCYYGTSTNSWPQNEGDLQRVLSQQSSFCKAFAGVCLAQEVGCELYTPVNKDPVVPGIAYDIDTCPAECVGYQVYKQEPTDFITNSVFRQFIADNKAKYCSAAYAGCDEFTNLDVLGQGAEAKEYYVHLKVCQKPAVDDAPYYTWEGSDTTGYQLRGFVFKKSNRSDDPEPDLTGNNISGYAPCTNLQYDGNGNPICNDPSSPYSSNADRFDFGICTKDDMAINSDCREFYDALGNIHRRLLSRTVASSDNCHPYRRTQTQATIVEAEADCNGSHGWWNNNTKECVYYAIPKQGTLCSAELSGCRAYVGNQGRNVRNLINDNFGTNEASALNGWVDGGTPPSPSGLMISLESTYPGGYSLSNKVDAIDRSGNTNYVIKKPVLIAQNKTYSLSFWAKGNADFSPTSIKFTSAGTNEENYFATSRAVSGGLLVPRVQVTNEWRKYDLGPVFVTWTPTDPEYLEFNLPDGYKIYLDNVVLKELSNITYVVENSWYTPLVCDNPWDDPTGAKALAVGTCQDANAGRCAIGEMLSCASYKDRAKDLVYLRSFTSLCRAKAAGCEALIDTHNSLNPFGQNFNVGGKIFDDVSVPADNLVYLVNDNKFACNVNNKGCRALGLPQVDKWDEITGYSTLYLRNDPDRYSIDLCYHDALWCDEFSTDNSLAYFKLPHGKICDFSQPTSFMEPGWYISGTTEKCQSTKLQSYGTGYDNIDNKVQPIGRFNAVTQSDNSSAYDGWVGSCPTEQSSCTEFVDQLNIGNNEIPNFNCQGQSSCTINLKADTLYAISGGLAVTAVTAGCNTISSNNGTNLGLLPGDFFYLDGGDTNLENCQVRVSNLKENAKIAKAGVYYKLNNSVDYTSCAGTADFRNGCVLFNNRGKVDYNSDDVWTRYFKYLTYNAMDFYKEGMQLSDTNQSLLAYQGALSAWDVGGSGAATNTADSLIKVKADRTCSDWLYCTNYLKGNVSSNERRFESTDKCLGFDTCNAVDDVNGTCASFTSSSPLAVRYKPSNAFAYANYTGYTVTGQSPLNKMTQAGSSALVYNGDFEQVKANSNAEPVGWTVGDQIKTPLYNLGDTKIFTNWSPDKFAALNSGNKLEGRYLRVNGPYIAESDLIDVFADTNYILTANINTLGLNPSGAQAEILVIEEDGRGGQAASRLLLPNGLPWTKVTLHLTTKATTTQLRIHLQNYLSDFDDVNCRQILKNTHCALNGYSSFDNINLSSSLKIVNRPAGQMEQISDYVQPSCRTYPDADSPACTYFSGNNYYYGWYGYCLTPDPQNPASCLQWWPVDNIAGDSADNVSYYNGRVPLYYCLASHLDVNYAFTPLESQMIEVTEGRGGAFYETEPNCVDKSVSAAFGQDFLRKDVITARMVEVYHSAGSGDACNTSIGEGIIPLTQAFRAPGLIEIFHLVYGSAAVNKYMGFWTWTQEDNPISGGRVIADANFSYCAAFIEFDGPGPEAKAVNVKVCAQDLQHVSHNDTHGIKIAVYPIHVNLYAPVCDMLTQTVTATGRNKAWSRRVSAGSTFVLPSLGTTYGSDYRPFGSVLAPEPVDYPENWSQQQVAGGPLGNVIPINGNTVNTAVNSANSTYNPTFNFNAPRAGDVFSCWINDNLSIGSLQLLQLLFNSSGTWGNNSCQIIGRCEKSGAVCLQSSLIRSQATVIEEQDNDFNFDNVRATMKKFLEGVAKFICFILNSLKNCVQDGVTSIGGDIARLTLDWQTGRVLDFLVGVVQGIGDVIKTLQCLVNQWKSCFSGAATTNTLYPCPIAGEVCVVNANRFGNTSGVNSSNIWQGLGGKTRTEWLRLIGKGLIPPNMVDAAVSGVGRLRQLFVKNYDVWVWNGLAYQKYGPENPDYGLYHWNAPDVLCPNNKRPVLINENKNNVNTYCATAPIISNIRINSQSGVILNGTTLDWLDGGGYPARGLVNIPPYQSVVLEFNVAVDNDQLPITALKIDWGDGNVISYSGVSLRDKTNQSNKFKFYHYYNPQKLFDRKQCDAGLECQAIVKIQVRDNWGWCNGNLDADGKTTFATTAAGKRPIGYFSGNNTYRCDSATIGVGVNNVDDKYCDGKYAGFSDSYNERLSGQPAPDNVYDCDDSDAWTRFPGVVIIRYQENTAAYDCLARCTATSFDPSCGQECNKSSSCCSDTCTRVHDATCDATQVNIIGDRRCGDADTAETINNSPDCTRVKSNDFVSLNFKIYDTSVKQNTHPLLYAFLDDWRTVDPIPQPPFGVNYANVTNDRMIKLTTKNIGVGEDDNPSDFVVLPQADLYNPTPSGKKFSLTKVDPAGNKELNDDGTLVNNTLHYGDLVYLHFQRCENEYSGSQTITTNPPEYLKYLNGNWDSTCSYAQDYQGTYYKMVPYDDGGISLPPTCDIGYGCDCNIFTPFVPRCKDPLCLGEDEVNSIKWYIKTTGLNCDCNPLTPFVPSCGSTICTTNIAYTQSEPQGDKVPNPISCNVSEYKKCSDIVGGADYYNWVRKFSHNNYCRDRDTCNCTQYATCNNFFYYPNTKKDATTHIAPRPTDPEISFCRDLVGGKNNMNQYLIFKIVSAGLGSAAKAKGDVDTGDAIQLQLVGYNDGQSPISPVKPSVTQGTTFNGPFCIARTRKSTAIGYCASDDNCKGKIQKDGYNIDLYPCTDLRSNPALTCLLDQSCADILKINAVEDDSRASTTNRW